MPSIITKVNIIETCYIDSVLYNNTDIIELNLSILTETFRSDIIRHFNNSTICANFTTVDSTILGSLLNISDLQILLNDSYQYYFTYNNLFNQIDSKYITNTKLSNAGDILTINDSGNIISIPAGTDEYFLQADSNDENKIKWTRAKPIVNIEAVHPNFTNGWVPANEYINTTNFIEHVPVYYRIDEIGRVTWKGLIKNKIQMSTSWYVAFENLPTQLIPVNDKLNLQISGYHIDIVQNKANHIGFYNSDEFLVQFHSDQSVQNANLNLSQLDYHSSTSNNHIPTLPKYIATHPNYTDGWISVPSSWLHSNVTVTQSLYYKVNEIGEINFKGRVSNINATESRTFIIFLANEMNTELRPGGIDPIRIPLSIAYNDNELVGGYSYMNSTTGQLNGYTTDSQIAAAGKLAVDISNLRYTIQGN